MNDYEIVLEDINHLSTFHETSARENNLRYKTDCLGDWRAPPTYLFNVSGELDCQLAVSLAASDQPAISM